MNSAPEHIPVPLEHRPNVYRHINAADRHKPQRFVISESDEQSSITSAWIATPDPVEVER